MLPPPTSCLACHSRNRRQHHRTGCYHSAGTLTRRLTSIAKTHEVAGHPSPATMRPAHVSEALKGIRRALEVEQKGKTPQLTADIQKILGKGVWWCRYYGLAKFWTQF